MAEWMKEEPTHELRWHEHKLQQKWKITRGGTGKVEYSEEWREVKTATESENGK